MSDIKYLRKALLFGMERSDDPRTKVGALIVRNDTPGGSILGANRMPRGVRQTPGRHTPSQKHSFIEHAERDVIYGAAREGFRTDGCVMYAPWFACCDCARAVIESGIREIVGLASLHVLTPPKWRGELAIAHAILREAGVGLRWVASELGETILFDGKGVEV